MGRREENVGWLRFVVVRQSIERLVFLVSAQKFRKPGNNVSLHLSRRGGMQDEATEYKQALL